MTRDLAGECRVRPAVEADASFILGLIGAFVDFGLPPGLDPDEHATAFGNHLTAALGTGAAVFVAVDESGRAVGFIHLQVVNDLVGRERAHISDLAVSEDARGHGVGGALLEFAEGWARDRGLGAIGLSAFATNHRALGVYERRGYAPTLITLAKQLTEAPRDGAS
jgi:GNAT superfamily N-acetyltransferase